MSHSNHPHARHPGDPSSLLSRLHPPGPSPSNRKSNKPKGRLARSGNASRTVIPGPVHNMAYITQAFKTRPLKWGDDQPKSPLNNFLKDHLHKSLNITFEEGTSSLGQSIWRAAVRIEDEGLDITAYGDDANKKEAERLAALSALYQLDAKGVFEKSYKKPKAEETLSPSKITLSDGAVVEYERARQFMDYYCRRFGFGRPDITYVPINARGSRSGTTTWQADMTVGGRRIGFGKGTTKKTAMTTCYVDVTQYLEECDPAVWKQFVEDAKTGKDIGMAPRVLFQIDDALEDQIHDLCQDIKASSLYKNRPKIGSHKMGDDAPDAASFQAAAPLPLLYRRPVPTTYLEDKSERLREQKRKYLNDPKLEHMRITRAALPVYTKAEDLLEHVRTHDVTICMAATGSGKTTQIPQLILDEWIAKGEGAKCNIVCTQPRRIAAISVAERVAKERGENAGRGSTVGYQVRFEANLPDEYGSITFCTTGIFLKRMQSFMLGDSTVGRDLDDVTHVVVDEVHERDIDTDLLLVVLKRLLADRKARNKPLKVVLMSATINPTLFQEYFPDKTGAPASVTEVPGRAFPVQKNFLDDFVPQLASNPSNSWVFQEESVQKYLAHQMGPAAPQVPGQRNLRHSLPDATSLSADGAQDDDLELPTPLLALTVAHVIHNSTDGHVLVFLPGWDDISNVQKCLLDSRSLYGINFNERSKFNIHLLHSSIPIAEQQVIFDPPPDGVRRIILATNIAETSVTIPDVVYVVDSAKIKEQRYDPERHISSLVSAWVGSSNLNQRAGRAGRHRPGEYYGILTRKFADELHPHQTVEMKRVDLSNVVMHIKALNFPGMTVEEVLAETIEPPAPERVEAAVKSLQMVGALDSHNNLTSLGRVLLQLPVDVQMGRLVLYGCFFRCLDQALTLAAILTNRDPFVSPFHLKAEAAAKKNSWSPEEFRSDALTVLRAFNAWWDLQKRGHYISANRFCMDNFLAKPTLLMIQKIKEQLLQSVHQAGVITVSAGGSVMSRPHGSFKGQSYVVPDELDRNADSMPLLAALIAIASQPKYAIRTSERVYRTAVDKSVFIHPSSVNHRKRETLEQDGNTAVTEKQIIAYAEKRQNMSTGSSNPQKFLVTTTRLDPLTYILFGAYDIEVVARGLECDGWLPVIGRQDALDDVERLKTLMESCMLRVFEGIVAGKTQQGRRALPERSDNHEDESGDEDDNDKVLPLSDVEIKELDLMTRDIVRVLDRYNDYRIATQSRHNSRPATPMDSPSSVSGRLPPFSGSRSGYSTPYNMTSSYNTRPSTPSQLSRRY
ncbi:P-loop containing nucleoside triphosphate hydrolase protein [Sparassis latifolia]|uniref:P-loop containing nucleoside triphosphate hydrolase protein n=1 Tax=Sparassis crispa TaxID=139825 RepID=A0A401G712_9APHY|nr:predicted protein [Sparassis crispa]GBE77943.1 predicted protein [Sparassis crispa]